MSYCFNPTCSHPQNSQNASTCQSCGHSLLLQQRYRILKPIGQGGFGRTFLAVDESQPAKPRCAIKQFFPHPSGPGNREKATELFRQEAQRLRELGRHPQIPELFAYLEDETGQYLVQEYIEGRNLARELEEEGAFNEGKIRQLLEDLLPVLYVIHNHSIIHRDLKPENIIRRSFTPSVPPDQRRKLREEVPATNQLVLVDFGAAKYTPQTALGKTGTVIGSAAYTAPEQLYGKAVFASDLYSLGLTCIHLLTLMPPFDLFDGSENRWNWRKSAEYPVSPELARILDKMLHPATKQRYQSAREVLQDLTAQPLVTQVVQSRKTWLLGGVMGGILLFSLAQAMLHSLSRQPAAVRQATLTQPTPQAVQYVPQEASPSATIPREMGGLYVPGQQKAFPLKHTEVSAKIAGNVSRVEVVQTFENPFNTPLEAIYQFPLPDESAVDDMEIRIGDRVIKGLIKERKEAQKIYNQAKQQGKTTGLLEQERDNVFTQSLANIRPGETIEVVIRYSDSLKFAGGNYEFVFPMVVGPRYSPNGRNSAVNSPTAPPTTRAGHDIGVTVEIDAGVPIGNLRSPSHQLAMQQIQPADGSPITQVQLIQEDNIPNKDLILRYQVAGSETQSTVLTHGDNRGGHFAAYLIPALQYQSNEIVPKDVVFLMDTSGSQAGEPLEQSKALMRRFINGLNPGDTFSIIDFASNSRALSRQPLANTPENRNKALNYINNLQADGGTELLEGINTVLNFPPAENGRLRSIVLITDGLIDDEDRIIARVQQQLQPGNRLYSFGVGSSVNRFLLNRMAEAGRGISHVVRHDEAIAQVTENFLKRLNNPVLTNIEVTWEGLGEPPEIYPLKAPDLFAEQPLVLMGRKQDRLSGNLRIRGVAAGGQTYEQTFSLAFDENGGKQAIAQLWGRAKIKELMLQMARGETPNGIAAVTNIALVYHLMSKYTAFVAVSDDPRVNANATRQTARVPVETPQGMKHSGDSVTSPEPSLVWAILLFGLFLGWKRWVQSKVKPKSTSEIAETRSR